MKKTMLMTAIAVMSTAVAMAQDAPREGREGRERGLDRRRQGDGEGRQFNPEQMRERMRQMMTARVKEQLKTTDEEWAVIEPLITRVNDLRRLTRDLRPQFGRGGPPQPPPEQAADATPVRKASDALRQSVETEGTAADTIKTQLDELRAARTAAEGELKKAQDELRAVLTVRQEAQLVLMGVLE